MTNPTSQDKTRDCVHKNETIFQILNTYKIHILVKVQSHLTHFTVLLEGKKRITDYKLVSDLCS